MTSSEISGYHAANPFLAKAVFDIVPNLYLGGDIEDADQLLDIGPTTSYVGMLITHNSLITPYNNPNVHEHVQSERPYYPLAYPISTEVTPVLQDSLWSHAEGLQLADYVVLAKGKNSLPRSINDYRLVPVLHKDPTYLVHSLSSIGHDLQTSSGVTFEYNKGTNYMPYMDGRIGLGLSFRDRLVALCTGGITTEGPIILQLQDVSNKIPPETEDAKILRSFPYSNGLHSGLDWKITLAQAWTGMVRQALPESLPGASGLPIWIQSAINNHWVNYRVYDSRGIGAETYKIDTERLGRFTNTYDQTAMTLGASYDYESRNFRLPPPIARSTAL